MAEAILSKTPLHSLHQELGARLVPFANYEMPVQYPQGMLKEHLHTRTAAGLFDVSHMGQIQLRAKSGNFVDAALALERLVPMDILDLAQGRQGYTFFTNERGGILDDLMVANHGEILVLVVNAARKFADEEHLRTHLPDTCKIMRLDRGLIALQGPEAQSALAKLVPEVEQMRFMDVCRFEILGTACMVSRSGYTGEDGFEISTPVDVTREIAEAMLENTCVEPIGLGARDSLRLEAGLCLYGSDLDDSTTPVEAVLDWAIPPSRRMDGIREGGFPGADKVFEQLAHGAPRLRVGIRPQGRVPVRAGTELYATDDSKEPIGIVTSGGFAPSLNAPAAVGYVSSGKAKTGTSLFAQVREKRLPALVCDLPFVNKRYKR